MPTPVRLDPGDLPVQRGDVTADLPCAETLVHQACPVSAPATPTRLHHFFERSCTANPRNLALVAGDDRLTYAALDARADQIAHHLLRRSVCAGDRVGLLLERSAPAYAALLAVLKCGAALVPLDPSFPAERIAYIAEDADLRLLVTAAKFGDAVAGARCPILALDADASVAASGPLAGSAEACKRAACGYGADDPLCYIIYTSGTTGRPKGVAVHQSNICNYLRACASSLSAIA